MMHWFTAALLASALVSCAKRAPGPEPDAMCSAASNTEPEPAKRFGGAVPFENGGGVYVLTGSRDAAANVITSLGLARVAIARCDPGDRLVVWVPGLTTDADGGDTLGAAFERNGLHVVERYAFHPVARGSR